MNIPEEVRIGSMIYTIQRVSEPVILDNRVCYGKVDYDKHMIRLDETLQDEQGLQQTLLHEIVHGISHENGIDFKEMEEEDVVDRLALGLHQIIRDNPEIFK